MTDTELEQNIADLAAKQDCRVGVCAQTLDGERSLDFNADRIFPAASSIKMYVFYTLLRMAEQGELALGERIELTAEAAKPGSGVLSHLEPGLRLTLKDLATLMMMISDNTALILLADRLGIDRINAEFSRLGHENSRIGDWGLFETNYEDSTFLGSASPREFVDFLLRLRRGELLQDDLREIFWDTLRIQKYIEPLRKLLPADPWARDFNQPEPVWVASKGGSMDDCLCESGFVGVNAGGWAISVMLDQLVDPYRDPDSRYERLISQISLGIYDAWAPLYP